MKNMLIVGRFQPFHSGHLEIIKKYHKKKYYVKIVIGSSEKAHQKKDPFTKEERIDMIEKTLQEHKLKNYEIIYVPDVPNDKEWVELVKKKASSIDVIFTGNPWVKKLFKREDVELHYFNEKLDRIKGIKANNIRKNLLNSKSKKGLPRAVYNQLKIIRAFDRLKDMNDPKKKVHYLLSTNNLTISTAESCTGGAMSKALISYSGSSKFFKGGIIAYSTDIKVNMLNVKQETITNKGIVSVDVAEEMAKGAMKLFKTDYAITTTGYADPLDKNVGNICVCVGNKNKLRTEHFEFKIKNRAKLIDKTTRESIKILYKLLKEDLLEKNEK